MKREIIIIAASFMIFFACKRIFKSTEGTGPVVTETRSLSGFKGVDFGVSGDVYITQGTDFKVVVETQANVAEILDTKVDGGILKIYFKNGIGNVNYDRLTVRVEAPNFESLALLGSGNIIAEGMLKGQSLALLLSGSGEIRAKDVSYQSVKADVLGSGNIIVGGTAEAGDFGVSGSGDIDAQVLKANQAKAEITGSGNIECSATNSLDASILGSGDIRYSGDPSVKSRVTGSGNVEKVK